MTFKDMKYNFIVDNSVDLFLEKGINAVTIRDIANHIGLGEATIYRYFSKKENLVLEVAIKLEEEALNKYFSIEKDKNGYDNLYSFYNSFLKVFNENKNFYRFISEFDNFIINKDCQMSEYEKKMEEFYILFKESYDLGINDKSINPINDVNNFYFTTTHSLMGLCKKLSIDKDILEQDLNINKEAEIEMLINIIMFSLKK